MFAILSVAVLAMVLLRRVSLTGVGARISVT
jgi:hypothetical protein